MEIITASGAIKVRKSSSVGKWSIAFLAVVRVGIATLDSVWKFARDNKPAGVSWSAWGKICGNLTHNGFGVSAVLY